MLTPLENPCEVSPWNPIILPFTGSFRQADAEAKAICRVQKNDSSGTCLAAWRPKLVSCNGFTAISCYDYMGEPSGSVLALLQAPILDS